MWYQVNVEGGQPQARSFHSSTFLQKVVAENDHSNEIGRVIMFGGKTIPSSPLQNGTDDKSVFSELAYMSIGLGCLEDVAKPQNKQSQGKLNKLLGGGGNSSANGNNNNNNTNGNGSTSTTITKRKTYSKLPTYTGSVLYHWDNCLVTEGNKPSNHINHSLLAINSGPYRGKVLLFGGINLTNNQCDSLTYILDPEQFWWESITPIGTTPSPRHSHYACQVSQDTILFFGGYNQQNQLLNDIYLLQLSGANQLKWFQPNITGTPPTSKSNFVTHQSLNSIWVLTMEGVLYKLDTITYKWSTVQFKGIYPPFEKDIQITSHGKYLIVLEDGDIYIFNTTTNEWKLFAVPGLSPMSRKGHTINMVGSILVLIGGEVSLPLSTQMTKDIEVIDLTSCLFD